jgi:hypothetical protein
MLHYVYFRTEADALAYRRNAARLGWTCSSPWDHGNGKWSVCTNRP